MKWNSRRLKGGANPSRHPTGGGTVPSGGQEAVDINEGDCLHMKIKGT
jgi:hypothetical protein